MFFFLLNESSFFSFVSGNNNDYNKNSNKRARSCIWSSIYTLLSRSDVSFKVHLYSSCPFHIYSYLAIWMMNCRWLFLSYFLYISYVWLNWFFLNAYLLYFLFWTTDLNLSMIYASFLKQLTSLVIITPVISSQLYLHNNIYIYIYI